MAGKVHQGLLSLLVEALSAAGFLTDHLQLSAKSAVCDDPDSYMGVCQVCPPSTALTSVRRQCAARFATKLGVGGNRPFPSQPTSKRIMLR